MRQRNQAEKLEQKQHQIEARTKQKELNKQLRIEKDLQKDRTKQAVIAKKRKREEHPPKEVEQPKSKKARSGRTVALPTRFME
jgi:hypothetical protein